MFSNLVNFVIKFYKTWYLSLFEKHTCWSVSSLSAEQKFELIIFMMLNDPLCNIKHENEFKHAYDNWKELFETMHVVYTVHYKTELIACVFARKMNWRKNDFPEFDVDDTILFQPKYLDLQALYVHQSFRRQRVATRLIHNIKIEAKEDKLYWLELYVDQFEGPSNDIKSHVWKLNMYRKMGFICIPRPAYRDYLLMCAEWDITI